MGRRLGLKRQELAQLWPRRDNLTGLPGDIAREGDISHRLTGGSLRVLGRLRRTTTGITAVSVGVETQNAARSATAISALGLTLGAAGDWVAFDGYITTPADQTWARPYIAVTGTGGYADFAWIDVRRGEPPPPGSVGPDALADGAVTQDKFADGLEPIAVVDSVPGTKVTETVFNTTDRKLYRWNGSAYVATIPTADLTGTISSGQIADAAVTTAKFAAGIQPVGIVTSVPGTKSTETVFNTTDGKLYRWNGSAYVATVPTTDLSGTISGAQIASAAITTAKFAAGIEPVTIVTSVPGTKSTEAVFNTTDRKLYRWNGSAYVATVPTTDLTGTIATAQIADAALTTAKFAASIQPVTIVTSVPGTKSTETVFNTTDRKLYRWNGSAYVATVAASDLSGQVADAQIAGLAASKVTGQLTDAQIAALAAAKLTGQITTTQITDGAISTGKLAAGSVTTAVLAAGAVTANEIAANAVTSAKILAGAVTTAKLSAGAVTANELAAGAVTAGKIAAGTIVAADIAADTITGGQIAAGAISTSELAAGAVTAAKIAAGTITANEIAAGAIGATQLAAGAVTAGKIAAGTIVAADIAADAITGAQIAAGAISTSELAAGAVTAAKIAAGTITANEIAAGAIGATQIAAGAVTAGKIAAGTIVAADIAADAITGAQIAAGAISTSELAAGAVTAAKIAAGTITANEIAAGAITATQLAAGAVTTTKLAAGAVTANEIAAGAVTAAKISVTSLDAISANLGSITVNSANIANAAIGTLKLAGDAVTVDKLTNGSVLQVGGYFNSTTITQSNQSESSSFGNKVVEYTLTVPSDVTEVELDFDFDEMTSGTNDYYYVCYVDAEYSAPSGPPVGWAWMRTFNAGSSATIRGARRFKRTMSLTPGSHTIRLYLRNRSGGTITLYERSMDVSVVRKSAL